MAQVFVDITMSLDGFVAGPDATLEQPLGKGGDRLHEWLVGLASWRERHGLSAGERTHDDELVEAALESTGAVVMGRKMFSGGEGPWEQDPRANGWWGDEDPPFRMPVFVLTYHARAPRVAGTTTFTFVSDGIEAAVSRAREAANGKNVNVAGGAATVQQALRAGLVDELRLHVAPVVLGDGVRLFENLPPDTTHLQITEAVASPAVAHLTLRPRS
jgi:dihydrofolate reductase